MTNAWFGNWYERIKNRVQEHGFETVTEFVDTRPTASLITLARELARERDMAAIQVERVLVHEAKETGTMQRCAMGLLVRSLHEQLPEGWHKEWDDTPLGSSFRRAGAFAAWYAALPDEFEDSCDRVWDALLALPIPEGWLPADRDDAFILEAFKHWETPA